MTHAASPFAGLFLLNEQPVEIAANQKWTGLTEACRIEHKADLPLASGDALLAELSYAKPLTCLQLTIPRISGWVRLNHAIPPSAQPALLAVSMVLRVTSLTGAPHEHIRPMLSREEGGQVLALEGCSETLVLNSGAWVQVRGLFACAAGADSLALLVNLPKDARVDIAALETDWFEILSDLGPENQQTLAKMVQTFTSTPVDLSDTADRCLSPSVYAARLRVDEQSEEVSGWALMRAQDTKLQVGTEEARLRVRLNREIEVLPGLSVRAGFSVSPHESWEPGALLRLTPVEMPLVTIAQTQLPKRDIMASILKPPRMIFFYPDYTVTNHYQTLMYENMSDLSSKAGSIDDAIAYIHSHGRPVIFHLHWLTPVFAGASTEHLAQKKCQNFIRKLAYFQHIGGQIIWTIHNLISHGAKFPNAEIFLSREVINLATKVHVHSKTLLPLIESEYQIPNHKLIIAEHPGYVGVFSDYVSRESARIRLDLPQDAKIFLFLGQLRPYKGIDRLVAAMTDLIAQDPSCHLVIAGKPVHPYSPGLLQRKFAGLSNVSIIEGFVPDDEVQWYYRAADWAVLPYTNILTSGSLLSALSFSCPVIAPDLGMIADVVETGWNGILYGASDPDGLPSALAQAARMSADAMAAHREAALESVRPLTWGKMGQKLQDSVLGARQMRSISLNFEDGAHEGVLAGRAFPPAEPARVAIVILNYENLDDVERLVGTLKTSTVTDFDIYVVDNASPNLSITDLLPNLNDVTILRLNENLGYAAGNNAALRLIAPLEYQFVWILNPDMVVSPEALEQHLTAAEDHPEYSIFGAAILRGGTDETVASAGCQISFTGGLSTSHMYPGVSLKALPDTPYEADFITGASVFLRTSVLKDIGYIPEDYFLYFEETHWLLEAARNGMKSLVLPHISLAHHKRSEESGLPAKYYYYYYIRNALLFTQRMTGAYPEETLRRLEQGFLAAWQDRIAKRAPGQVGVYTLLAQEAIADGLAGIAGQKDLVALEIRAIRGQFSTAPHVDAFQAEVTPDRLVQGSFDTTGSGETLHHVTLICNGSILQTIPCLSDGLTQRFEATLAPGLLPDAAAHFEFYVDDVPIPNMRRICLFEKASPVYKGRIDGLTCFTCKGWLWDVNAPHEPVELELLHEGQVVATGRADLFRADLKRNNIADGNAAFAIPLPRYFSDATSRKLQLRVVGTTTVVHERAVQDHVVKGGMGPEPVDAALKRFFHERHCWLARHSFDALPVGRHIEAVQATLVARHEGRNSDVKVSVVMPAFNRENLIAQAIESVRAQTHANWELLVVDDGSTDRTTEVVRSLIKQRDDSRVRLIELSRNRGVSAARNAGLQQADGSIIAYLDSDNVWMPDYLSVMIGELLDQPDYVQGAYCGQKIMQVRHLDGEFVEELVAVRMGEFSLSLMENRNFIDLNCFVHRRQAYTALGGFNEEMRRLVDWELILRYSLECAPHYVPVLLSNYYFDKADNQITKLENYDSSFAILRKVLAAHSKRQHANDHAPLTDVVLLACGSLDSTVQRVADLLGRIPQDARLLIGLEAQDSNWAEGMAQINDPRLVCATTEMLAQVTNKADAAQPGFESRLLRVAIRHRREGADLAVLTRDALPDNGWLRAFAKSAQAVPDSGILVSRRIVPGNRPEVERAQPFAARSLDVCLTLSAAKANVVTPLVDPVTHVAEISGFDPFCFLIRSSVVGSVQANALHGTDLDTISQEIVDLTRFCLKRRALYCARSMVREIREQ